MITLEQKQAYYNSVRKSNFKASLALMSKEKNVMIPSEPFVVNLKNLATATAQQVFDQCATHLLTQKVQSRFGGESGHCAYRGTGHKSSTLKCGAGCLIADDEYTPEMDASEEGTYAGTSWKALASRGLVPDTQHTGLIGLIQRIHDSEEPEYWLYHLSDVADKFGLNKKVLDNR